MKCFSCSDNENAVESILVYMSPNPHVLIGEVQIPIEEEVIRFSQIKCPHRVESGVEFTYTKEFPSDPYYHQDKTCPKCGEKWSEWKQGRMGHERHHPDQGSTRGRNRIEDVSVQKFGNELKIVSPQGDDHRVLVRWELESGRRGHASIEADEGVRVIATGDMGRSPKGRLGNFAIVLAILSPSQKLIGRRSGGGVIGREFAVLNYNGETVSPDLSKSFSPKIKLALDKSNLF